MLAANVYEVVLEGSEESIHRVTMSPEFYKQICGGTFTQEWVLIQAFRIAFVSGALKEFFVGCSIGCAFQFSERDMVRGFGAHQIRDTAEHFFAAQCKSPFE